MTDDANAKDVQNMLFANLIIMLSSSAMQQLGKLVNPEEGKPHVELEAAQVTIDMLSMLKEKTRGNLDDSEQAMLNDLLASLQLNFVETARQAQSNPAEDKDPASAHPETAEEPKPEVSAGGESHDPKFHKSYGS